MRRAPSLPIWIGLLGLLAPGLPGCDRGGAGPSGKSFTLTVEGPSTGKPGEPMAATVRVIPGKGYKVNLEFPTKLQVTGPAETTMPKKTLTAKDAARYTAEELLMKPSFTLARPGSQTFKGQLAFSVCTEQLCELKTEAVTWVAEAK
jgi:hypothetical protein